MRFGEAWPNRHDLSSLRLLGSVGEPINPEAWRWYHRVIGKERCPIMDTWWQTETGMFMITPLPVVDLKPGSATRPFPGIEADVFDEHGNSVAPGEEGYLVLKQPWPAMLRTIYKDPDRYVSQYWSQLPGRLLHRRQRAQGQGRLLLDHRPRGRCDQGVGLPAGHRRDRERAGQPSCGGRGRRHRPAARDQGQCHPHLRDPEGRARAGRGVGGGADGSTSATSWGRSPSRRRSPSSRNCRRRAAARSCAACCVPARWGCRKGI